ncbi:MAG: hypothetical protein JXM79_03300 [Sedimentisphaerales bacterium]|nr:hypothetical protein [Sedimentisphaerales bacterium]
MFAYYRYKEFIVSKTRNIVRRVLLVLRIFSKVTVLLFIIASAEVCADDANGTHIRLFEFSSEFYMPMGNGRIDGLMAYDGSRHRIAIYWIEPSLYRDPTYFLVFSDFIFTEEKVHYWIHGTDQPATFDLSDINRDFLLPRDVLPESVARSALAISTLARSEPQNENVSLEVGTFFRQSRGRADYSYELPSEECNDLLSDSNVTDVQILNALPFGRKYSKETQSDGSMVWCAQRVLSGPHVARVTVKPITYIETGDPVRDFDPDTLGHWMRIPESYRTLWSFDRVYLKLKDQSDKSVSSRELHDKIEIYLAKNKVPFRLDLAFNQLWFKTSLLTSDTNRILHSAHDVVTAICRDGSISPYRSLLELARIDVQIRERYPQQSDRFIRSLIGLMVQ